MRKQTPLLTAEKKECRNTEEIDNRKKKKKELPTTLEKKDWKQQTTSSTQGKNGDRNIYNTKGYPNKREQQTSIGNKIRKIDLQTLKKRRTTERLA